jgi:hypothetical protein
MQTLFSFFHMTLPTVEGIKTYMGVIKSTDRVRIENFIMTVASLLLFINDGSRFYIFFAVSKAFRKDFKQFWTRIIKRRNERVIQAQPRI